MRLLNDRCCYWLEDGGGPPPDNKFSGGTLDKDFSPAGTPLSEEERPPIASPLSPLNAWDDSLLAETEIGVALLVEVAEGLLGKVAEEFI